MVATKSRSKPSSPSRTSPSPKPSGPVINKDSVTRALCKRSFYDFVKTFWSSIIAEEPVWNWHIKFLCDQIQTTAERVFRGEKKLHDVIINIPPGTTKSTIFSVMFPAWVWTRMPSARFICGSHGYNLAMDLSRRSRDVIKSPLYLKLFPEVELRDDQDAKGNFMNSKGGMRVCFGVDGGVIGIHAHFIIVDDPINPKDAMAQSDVALKTTNDWMDQLLSQRKVDKEITVTILVMQRLHQNDPTGHWLKKKKKETLYHICLPAIEAPNISPPECRKYYKDKKLDVKRLSDNVLEEQKEALGEYGFAGQYQQSPVPREGGMFKVGMLKKGMPPGRVVAMVRFWDKAGTDGAGAFTAGVKMGMTDGGNYVILHAKRGQWDSGERETIIRQIAEMDGPNVEVGTEQEPGSGGKDSAHATARNLAGFSTFIDKVTGSKTVRADPFSSQVNLGHVYIVEGEWNTAYLDEMSFFPFSSKKDQIDASSGAFSRLMVRRKMLRDKERDEAPLITNILPEKDHDRVTTIQTSAGDLDIEWHD